MTKRILIVLIAGILLVPLTQGGCQSSSSKKKDIYGKDFQQRVAADPFPHAGTPIR